MPVEAIKLLSLKGYELGISQTMSHWYYDCKPIMGRKCYIPRDWMFFPLSLNILGTNKFVRFKTRPALDRSDDKSLL